MHRTTLTADEIREIDGLLSELCGRYDSVEDPEFLRESHLYAHDLPRRIRRELLAFRNLEPTEGLFVLSGWPVDEGRIGLTPERWDRRTSSPPTLREEILFVLATSVVGTPIAWATQQNGFLMHDILPIQGLENEQLGFSSEELLWWHTEDAFHPFRGDYIAMMCMRNPDRVPTTVCSLRNIELDENQIRLLMEPIFPITPDESHLPKNQGEGRELDEELQASYANIEDQFTEPEKIPVLFGDPNQPYVRLDPYFMKPVEGNPEAQAAFDTLTRAIDENLEDVVLEAGDICLVDNFRAVHGRKPFKARYDGRDRWLKRLNVVRDLRKSRSARGSSDSRVILESRVGFGAEALA